MTDWTQGYGVTFEYWEVDADTMRDRRQLYAVEECEITRDSDDDMLGSATMSIDEWLDSETYVRCYLVAEQPPKSGNRERVCLGTFLAQTSTLKMDGKVVERPLELSTPLKELADDSPPPGYTVRKGTDAVTAAERIFSRYHVKVAKSTASATVPKDIVANDSDSWLTLGLAVLESVGLEHSIDPYGTVTFSPVRDAGSMAFTWTYADDDYSILMPDAEMECDWPEVPNVVEVIVSGAASYVTATCENDDPASPVSTATRGRVVKHVERDPEGVSTKAQAQSFAVRKLRELSCGERELLYSHGYCPVRLGDCVRLMYGAHGLDAKARVTRQVIRCKTDLEVEETARYSEVLWNG